MPPTTLNLKLGTGELCPPSVLEEEQLLQNLYAEMAKTQGLKEALVNEE